MLRLISIQAIREVVNSNIAPKNAFVPLKQAFKKLDDPVVKKLGDPIIRPIVGVCRGILSSSFAINIIF